MPLKLSCSASDNDKHKWDINSAVYKNGKLYSASDDGKIKCWSKDLRQEAEIQAHPCSVFSVTASSDTLYSCSNDGTIKSWTIGTLEAKKTLKNDPETEFWKVVHTDAGLLAGDNNGFVTVYKNDKFFGGINLAEPVKELISTGSHIITSNLLDVIVTKIITSGEKVQFDTCKVLEGRAPLTLVGTKICFSSRDGRNVVVHKNDDENGYPKIGETKNGSELVINALTSVNWNGSECLFSGGWDKTLKKWKLSDSGVDLEESLLLEFVITSLTAGDRGEIFVGGEDGHLVRIDDN